MSQSKTNFLLESKNYKSIIGVMLLCLFCILLMGRLLVHEMYMYSENININENSFGDEFINLWEYRFQKVKYFLPDNGFIGLVSDAETPDDIWRVLIQTQYILVPRVIVEDDGSVPIVIGSYRNQILSDTYMEKQNLHRWIDFGDGIFLLRRGNTAH